MMSTVALIAVVIILEAGPVSAYVSSAFYQQEFRVTPYMIGAFAAVIALCVATTIIPIRIGLKRMEGFEF